jgi:hypothetical protein
MLFFGMGQAHDRRTVELSFSYLMADSQSTSSSWYWPLLSGPLPDFIHILILSFVTIVLLCFLQGTLPEERTGL